MTLPYRDRALEDILEAERKLRETAERTMREYRSLVIELAQRLAGEALEARRVENPGVPQVWTPADWRTFWTAVVMQPVGRSSWQTVRGNGNGSGQVKALEGEIERLKGEVEALRSALERSRIELAQERKAREELTKRLAEKQDAQEREKARQKPKPEQKQPNQEAKHLVSVEMLSTAHRAWLEELREMVIPDAPLRFREQLNPEEALRYRRKVLILYLLATKGICSRLEIDRLLSALENVSARTNSVRRPADELVKSGLLEASTLRMESPFATGMAVYRLTEDGRALCRAWGWDVVENEWERLLRLHQGEVQEAHTVMILAFALHARLRGWNARILPQVDGTNAVPDVVVERDGERWYVEVERGDGSRRKWKNLAKLNGGRVALCAADPAGRERLVRDCKAERLGGVAADLRTLVFDGDSPRNLVDISPAEPLWLETW